jgi:hypothetical protein
LPINFFEILNLRGQFEELTSGYNMPDGSDINTIEWFIENGHRSNSLRNGFDDAMQLAKTILTESKKYGRGTETPEDS